MIGKKKHSVVDPRPPPPRPTRTGIPFAIGIRMFLIGSIAVIASAWAIWRHYMIPRPPMVVPAPPAASTIDIDTAPP